MTTPPEPSARPIAKEIIDRFNLICTQIAAQVEGDEAGRIMTGRIVEKAKGLLLEGPSSIPFTLSALVVVFEALGDERARFLFEVINMGFAALSGKPHVVHGISFSPTHDADDDDDSEPQGTAEEAPSPPSDG